MSENPAIVSLSPPWLAGAAARAMGFAAATLSPLAGDAGSRAYFRMTMSDSVADSAAAGATSSQSYIVALDAAPEQQRRFLRLRDAFADAGARAPQVLAHGEQHGAGWLVLEDFGDDAYGSRLPDDAPALYTAAIETLTRIQRHQPLAEMLPPYSAAALRDEMRLFEEWYCRRHLSQELTPAAQKVVAAAGDFLVEEMTAAPQVATHRDYHSRNLMMIGGDSSSPPGVLDFQDAVRGNALYDVVSLLRDAYIEWAPDAQRQWFLEYQASARDAGIGRACLSDDAAWRQYNLAGAQRGLKVVGIFARLNYRDGKARYLENIPLAYEHLLTACRELPDAPALAALAEVVADLPPAPLLPPAPA